MNVPVVEQVAGTLRRRFDGAYRVDEWGLDPDLVDLLSPLLAVRWGLEAQWPERIPATGAAVLVSNRRAGVSEPFVLARGVRLATGRYVRTVGVPDVAPVGTVARHLGGVLARPDEVAGVLRAGHIVSLPLARSVRGGSAGACDERSLAAARALGVPVVPVALVGREIGRTWRLLVGEAVPPPTGRGPLAVADDAVAVRSAVQQLLDEAGPRSMVFG